MIESRCGTLCGSCRYRESMGCKGCLNIDNPFWGECSAKQCCERKGLAHCGQCGGFVCDMLNEMAYDKKEGDNGLRLERCRAWLEEEKKAESLT